MLLKAPIKWIKNHWIEIVILLVFGVIFSLVSLVNHYNFRTSALDLGVFNHALYSFAHGKMNYFTLGSAEHSISYFADHFSPITLLYTPLYYVFGSWTVLLVQIAALLFGAFGCYRVCEYRLPQSKLKYGILVLFLSQWSLISALSFDFHNNVVAAMFVPWLYYYYIKSNRKLFLLFFFLILISKENMALWLVFILIGFLLDRGWQQIKINWKGVLKFEVPLILFSAIYFYVIVFKVMPDLAGEGSTNIVTRIYAENSGSGFLRKLLNQPIETLKVFFEGSHSDFDVSGIKREFHKVSMISGVVILLLRPAFFLMLLPLYAQKMLTDNYVLWGINAHYSIEFAPIIVLGMISFVALFNNRYLRVAVVVLFTMLSGWINLETLKERKSLWYQRVISDFRIPEHYQSGGLDVPFVHKQLKAIPSGAVVSANTHLVPHLSNRDKIYQFPFIADAEYIVLLRTTRNIYPLNQEQFNDAVSNLINSSEFDVMIDEKDLLIFHKPH